MLKPEKRKFVKKILLLAILFQFIFSGCSKSASPSFYRTPRTQDSKAVDYSNLNIEKGFNGSLYYSFMNATIPYFRFSSDFTFKCEESGYSGLYFNLYSKTADELIVGINTSSGVVYKNFSLKVGINEILLEKKFLYGDKVSITIKSGYPCVVSNPIFFKQLPKPQRELIFLISVDTLAAAHMSIYGYKKETTPNIKSFARDSVVFNNAFANSSWTVSAHMSLFTSLLEYGHKVHVKKDYINLDRDPFVLKNVLSFPLSPLIPTLTDYLSKNYLTFSFNGGANVSAKFAFYRGFDLYLSDFKDMNDPRASVNMFEKVEAHLEKFPLPKAFYFLHTYQVHAPYNPLPEYISKEELKPKIQKFDFYSDLGGIRSVYKPYPIDFIKDVVTLYDAEITGFDIAFNDFITYLKLNKLYDNSTIILLSDHGEEFLEPSSWVHASNLYTNQIWIPLIIKFPRQEHSGKNILTPVSLVDVMPTVLAYKGLPAPDKIHGQSFLDLIAGKKAERPPVIATLFRSKPEIYFPGKISIIQNGLKLIYNEPYPPAAAEFFRDPTPPIITVELFDLSTDRFEKINILNSHKHDLTIKLMFRKLKEVLREMEKSFQIKNPANGTSLSAEVLKQLRSLGYL